MIKLTTDQFGHLLHKSRHEPRRNQKRYLKDLGGDGSAEELDAMLEQAEKSRKAVAVADELDKRLKHTLRAVEQGMIGQVAEMIGCVSLEMERQGLTQSELASRCNLTQPMLSDYLKGKRTPTLANLAKMATAMECSWRLIPIDELNRG